MWFSPRAQAFETTWDPSFNVPGADFQVYTMAETTTDIYYAGGFRAIGTAKAAFIVRFHKSDSTWHPLPGGTNGAVNKILFVGPDLYVGGTFTTAGTTTVNNIAKWNGTTWSALGTGIAGGFAPAVSDMTQFNGQVYVTGSFTTAGGVTVNSIARWNGASWSAVGTGLADVGFSGSGKALAVMGSNLYITGEFETAGGVTCNNIARWTGSTWEALHPDGLSGGGGRAYCLAVMGADLYVGGYFSRAGTVQFGSDNLMKWNGTTFSGVGGGANDTVYCLTSDGSNLYVGGEFTSAGGVAASHVAKWSGSTWSALGAGTNGDVLSVSVLNGGILYAGGTFSTAGTAAASKVARWTGSAWEAITSGKGLSGSVNAMVDTGTHIYVGGSFVTAGPIIANGIALFDKTAETWSPLGSGLGVTGPQASFGSASVSAILVDGANVYVGGSFNLAGGLAVNNIAKWDGVNWTALSNGVGSSVTDIVKIGSDLYISGFFNTASGTTVNCVAKWNGTAWSALGSGVSSSGYVTSLAVMGTDLFVAGNFTMAGGGAAKNIAKWNGTAWSALGTGLDYEAEGLLVDGSDLYVVGEFEKAGGVTVNGVAKWNGSAWSALGAGTSFFPPTTLTKSGSNLFIGGRFTSAGGSPAQYVAAWNGTAWEAVAENLVGVGLPEPSVNSIIINDTKAYFGTTLIAAGNVPFGRFGKATLTASSNKPLVDIFGGTLPKTTSVSIAVTVNPKGLTTTATLHYGTTQEFGTTKSIPLSPPNGTAAKTILVPLTGLTPGTQYYYRAIASNSAGTSETPINSFTTPSPPIIDVPPASNFVVQGTNLTLTPVVRGTPFLTYQWLKKTTPIPNAQGPNLVLNAITLAQAGEYAVKVTNGYGTATSTPLAKIAVIDTTDKVVGGKALATLVIPVPAAGPGLTFQWYKGGQILVKNALGGRATGVDTAKLSIAKFSAADEDNYTCVVKLGAFERTTGIIAAKVQSPPQIAAVPEFNLPWIVSGSVDAQITELITFLDPLLQNRPTKYVIANLPTGLTYNTTTGAISGKPTKSGPFKVKITASNSAGAALPVEVTVNVAALDTPLVGVFNGLVARSTDMNSKYGGTLNLTTTLGGGVSGKVVMAGKSYSLTTGALNATAGANATAQIPVKFGTVTLTLSITINRTTGELTGTLSDNDEGEYGSADVSAWRNSWSGKTPGETATAHSTHPFTAIVRPTSSSSTIPPGQGYGFLTITKTGIVTWKGQLADATTMTCSTTMGPNGEIPLHVMLYTNTGSLQGWTKVTADNATPANNLLDNLAGQNLTWFKNSQPAKSTTRSYKTGISLHNLIIEGSAWPKPTGLIPLTGLSDASATNNAQIVFTGAGVEASVTAGGAPLTQSLRIKSPSNAVAMPPAAQNPGTVTLSLNAATGEIKGAFTLKADPNPLQTSQKLNRTANYFGVVVKRLGKGFGHFNLAKLPEALPGQTPAATTPTTSPMRSGLVELKTLSP
ncbi:immunoglobulin domain-containing protein [Brevifollis gellanilyticus]|uniref:immunoglobulin domain-containing protein n=1 Tax=Brevifollis gellanilyticus TaxID=748831 RepID=UPI001478243F|nr:immunoglobulin domain-containing protein [Brevifollis gellanilyticus]